ncbi:hypothetical protein ZWY2020_037620 [Hordeum vulgare]|nr:hypothetical protein ZWY2020_037620 [Hordeum vulgare]
MAKPEDWLIDYTTAVAIATVNKHVAVRYVPLMLTCSARTGLNSLPTGRVNSWVDFEEAFVRNFTGTYKRPSRPHELAMCIQKPDEPLRDYVNRWTEHRNSCEGVHEVQAIDTSPAVARRHPPQAQAYVLEPLSGGARGQSGQMPTADFGDRVR